MLAAADVHGHPRVEEAQRHQVHKEVVEPQRVALVAELRPQAVVRVVLLDGGAIVSEQAEHARLVRLARRVDDGKAEHQVLLILSTTLLTVLDGAHAPARHTHQLDEARARGLSDVQAGVDAAEPIVQHAVKAERAAARRGVQRSMH